MGKGTAVVASALCAWLATAPAHAASETTASVGLAWVAGTSQASGSAPVVNAAWHWQDKENLPNEARRRLRLSLLLEAHDSNCPPEVCASGPTADALASVTISHYARGELGVGRLASLTAELTRQFLAFGGETVGADRCLSSLSVRCGKSRPLGVEYQSPRFSELTFAGQLFSESGALRAISRLSGSWSGFTASVAFDRQSAGKWELPVGTALSSGRWEWLALVTVGSGSRRYAAMGLTAALRGGEVRVHASRYANVAATDGSSPSGTKVAVGYHWPLTARVIMHVDAAAVRWPGRDGWQGVNGGMRFGF